MSKQEKVGSEKHLFGAEEVDFDRLSPVELDGLPYGIIQVDGEGRVMFYSAAASRFSGHAVEAVVGRDFFRDVAPSTHFPEFHGRFLEGVRRGSLDECFRFVFSFDPRPVRVKVRMRSGNEPDRYWISVHPLGTLALTRQRAAALAAKNVVEQRARAEAGDASVCEREPIHTPGAVQRHAVMLALDPATLVVQACSENLGFVIEEEPATVIGRTLDALMPPPVSTALRTALARNDFADPARSWRSTVRLRSAPYALAAHLYDGRLVVELERVPERPEDFDAATPLQAQDAITALRKAANLRDVADVAAREIRAMTGFERVLVYRFDADWNGEAVAESKVGDWEHSLLGLRFPASDIPAQARALYTRAPSRFVVDRDAVPAAVLIAPHDGKQSVDLTFAASRALSPVHLEYHRSLGVNGSMSISILVEERLWGLAIGHHRRPHYVTPETRALAGVVADTFALRVHELESVQAWREQQATFTAQNGLLERLAASDDVVTALVPPSRAAPSLLDLFSATGAAIVSDRRIATVGAAPPEPALAELAQWLREALPADKRAFATAELSAHYTLAEALRSTASGCLAAFVDRERNHVLIWFRPEVTSTVVWGGNPNKPVLAEAATQTVLPRRSFERWVEERRGHAEAWTPWQVRTAEAIAAAVEDVVLRQGRKIAELTAKQEALTRALERKDVLAREIDHRVKNSLQIVSTIMMMQARSVADPEAKRAFEDTYARVMSVARVHDSLLYSEDVEKVDLSDTLRLLCNDLAAGITGAVQRLDVSTEPGLMVASRTAVALSLITTELVTNALKYAYAPEEPGRVVASVKARSEGGLELRVCDAGRGLPKDWAERSRASGKGGLGMRIIRAMVDQIGAHLSVEDNAGRGACFTVRL
jgi:chemotaxis family two-component system sensor kinase Cph1